MGKLSIPFFAYYYLDVLMPPHQQDWIDNLKPKTIILSPRDHGKTHTFARVFAEHYTLYNNDVRLLLFGKSHRQSMKSLGLINNDLKKNHKILKDFGFELADLHKKDNMLWYNRQKGMFRDATIEAAGLYGAVTGSHYEYILIDDLIDDENTRTAYMMEQVSNWFKGTVSPLLEPNGTMIVIGTRKHYNDLYSELVANPLWYVKKDKAIIKMPDNYEFVYDEKGNILDIVVEGDSKVLWESKWTIEDLLLKREEIGTIFFNREYQNDPSGLHGLVLDREWLKFYDFDDIYNASTGKYFTDLEIYQAWDLAIAETEGSDYTVCVTFGVTRDNKMYVLDIFRDRISFPKQVDKVIELASDWKPIQIGIESNTYQLALSQQVKDISFLPIKEIYNMGNKERRIIKNSVYYEGGRVLLPDDLKVVDDFIAEYVQFPRGGHDDMLDAMCTGFEMVKESSYSGDPYQIVVGGGTRGFRC